MHLERVFTEHWNILMKNKRKLPNNIDQLIKDENRIIRYILLSYALEDKYVDILVHDMHWLIRYKLMINNLIKFYHFDKLLKDQELKKIIYFSSYRKIL